MLKIYNTLSRKKDAFRPINPPRVGMYVCGPTVYGPGHVGHARTYVAFDIIRRYLEYRGFKVKYVMNITDVHDDIFKAMRREKLSLSALTDKYTSLFLKEQKLLGIKKADYYPRVTKHVKEIINFVKTLIKRGFGYRENGSIYFDVSKFKDYGKLSRIKIEKAIPGTRVETDKYEKKEAIDFALWKEKKPKEPSWSSPWGEGRPGWHIECSVMSQKYLGKQFDIHGGAKDLIFPHHENEIAQSEAATGKKPFVKYWMHSGLLTINGQKMSKSLGNYIEITQALERWPVRVIRLFVANSHYRSPQDWSKKALKQAKKEINKIDEFTDKLKSIKSSSKKLGKRKEKAVKNLIKETKKKFEIAMNDDFNTPQALAVIFRFINEGNSLIAKGKLTPPQARDTLKILKEIDKVFSFIFWGKEKKLKIPDSIAKLVQEREKARKEKKWKAADEIRKKIRKAGFLIKDTKEGPKIKKL
jgi:cysteinyl-tRNA synthetase